MSQHEPTITSSPTRTDAWLALAAERLVQELDPECVMLFGSYARGTQSRTSDIDVFVVWDTPLGPLERIGRVMDVLSGSPRPVEAVVYTPAELERNRSIPFIRRILSEGRVLYQRNDRSIP